MDALLEAIGGEDSDSSKGIIRNGTEDPSDSLGMPGDMYVNTITQKVFLKGEHWEIKGSIGDPDLSQYYTKVEVDRILSDSYYTKA